MTGIEPRMPVTAYRSFAIRTPKATHFRTATCREVECAAWQHGWTTSLDLTTPLGQKQATYIRMKSGREFVFVTATSNRIVLWFPPGQKCFAEHKVPLDKPPLFIVRDGDRRGNPTGFKRLHTRAIDWRDDFGEHQEKLAEEQRKG